MYLYRYLWSCWPIAKSRLHTKLIHVCVCVCMFIIFFVINYLDIGKQWYKRLFEYYVHNTKLGSKLSGKLAADSNEFGYDDSSPFVLSRSNRSLSYFGFNFSFTSPSRRVRVRVYIEYGVLFFGNCTTAPAKLNR